MISRAIELLSLALILVDTAAVAGEERSRATTPVHPVAPIAHPFMETETVRLWAGQTAGATDESIEQPPTMTIFRPQKGQANGATVIVAPGGGDIELAGNIEGRQVADWFPSRGITAFALKYRIGPTAPPRYSPASAHERSLFVIPQVREIRIRLPGGDA